MRKLLKIVAVALLFILVAAQLVRPARVNPPVVAGNSIEEHVKMTPRVSEVLRRSCMDCHSNRTEWPWYSNVAPVSWFVIDHVKDGRRHLNFSEWTRLTPHEADEMLKAICQFSKGGMMPLDSYTFVHRSARLSQKDVKTLCDWAQAETHGLATLK